MANRNNDTRVQDSNAASNKPVGIQSASRGNKQSGDTSTRGFASMDPQRQREIASQGGRAAHASGNAHEFTSEEARRAGSMSRRNSGSTAASGNSQSGSRGNSQSEASGSSQSGDRAKHAGVQGGTPEQHAAAGRQSHKNSR